MKWRVVVKETRTFEVEVVAKDYSTAGQQAIDLARGIFELHEGETVSIPKESWHYNVRAQLGEPWVHGAEWYDLHPQEGPSNVIVLERATGNVFTQEDVDLLKARINAIPGLTVNNHWNGVGASSVSFQVDGRNNFDPLTDDQVSAITAPRQP